MRILTIAAVALLAGCATPEQVFNAQQMLHAEPRLTYVTSKSVEETEKCLVDGIRAVAKSGHNVGSRREGLDSTVWVTALANPVLSVQISTAVGGTAVAYRSRFKAGSGHYTSAVSACR